MTPGMSPATDATAHLSSFAIELLAQGTQRTPAEAQRAEQHLAGCAVCTQLLAETRAAHELAARELVPGGRQKTVRKLERKRSFVWAAVTLVPAFCAVLAFVFFPALQRWGGAVGPDGREADGIKGDVNLQVFAQRADRVFPVTSGATLTAGDRVRFEIEPAGLPYLMVASVDAAGQVSIYVPYQGTESVRVAPEERFVSPGSIELDRVPGPERTFALLSREPLQASAVTSVLRALGARGPAAIREQANLQVTTEAQRSFLWENVSP